MACRPLADTAEVEAGREADSAGLGGGEVAQDKSYKSHPSSPLLPVCSLAMGEE